MRNETKRRVVMVIFLGILYCGVNPGETTAADAGLAFQGELTGWTAFEENDQAHRELGFRYLPRLKLALPLSDGLSLDSEIMANLYGTLAQTGAADAETAHGEKAYRLWARAYTDQAEVRLGLQEISFGPGKILRSLRWFDQKDSRDPTGFTDGVNALLFRYYFESNANVWIWSMTGNRDPMGISLLTASDGSLESGGRIQIPAGAGELGLSVHQRQVDLARYSGRPSDPLQENRVGFDLSWDLGVGLYLETTWLELARNPLIPEHQLFFTLGGDYTFDVGDGLNSVVELMAVDLKSDSNSTVDGTIWLLAISEQLPLNLLDKIQVMAFRNFESRVTTLQTAWQRSTDDWVITLMVYTSHFDDGATGSAGDRFSFNSTTGQKGIRLLIQTNH
ncbi:MAG: hypothetical protein ABIK68_05750 [bacterium]